MNINPKTGQPKVSHASILLMLLIPGIFLALLIVEDHKLAWFTLLIISLVIVGIPQFLYSLAAEHYVRTLSDRTSPNFYVDNDKSKDGDSLIPLGILGRHVPATYRSLVMEKAPWVFSAAQQLDCYVITTVHELIGMSVDDLLDFAVAQWEMEKRFSMGSASKLARFDNVLDEERDRIIEEWEDIDHSDILFGLIGDSLKLQPFKEKDIAFYQDRLYTLSFNRQVLA